MKLIKYDKQVGLAEIGQSMGTKFALLSKDGETFTEITPTVKCRDFLCDCYSSAAQKTKFSIYGMSWDGTAKSPDQTGLYLSLVFPSAEVENTFMKNIAIIHNIEKANKIPLTKVNKVENGFIVQGNKRWLQNCLLMSLYTFLLRVACYNITPENWIDDMIKLGASDSEYVKSVDKTTWEKVSNNIQLFETPDWNGLSYVVDGTSAVHHNSGFISVCGTHSEVNPNTVKKNKHWQQMQKLQIATYIK